MTESSLKAAMDEAMFAHGLADIQGLNEEGIAKKKKDGCVYKVYGPLPGKNFAFLEFWTPREASGMQYAVCAA